MTANTTPLFVATPFIGLVSASVGNTNRNGSGSLYSLATGSENGSRVDWIQIKAEGTTAVGMVRFYISPWGSDSYDITALFDEVSISAITPSSTVKSFQYTYFPPRPLILSSGSVLWASTVNSAEGMQILAFGGNF